MTKTNSLKKALAGILAACMAATTLVAAPFTFGDSQSVGAASLDEMELLAQYSFESGYTDSVSGESGTAIYNTGLSDTINLQKDDSSSNTYLSIAGQKSQSDHIRVANPVQGDSAVDLTISAKVRVYTADNWQGLLGFQDSSESGFIGLTGNGNFYYNDWNGVYKDYNTYGGSIPANAEDDATWHTVVMSVSASSNTLALYVDNELVYSISDANIPNLIAKMDYFTIGACASKAMDTSWQWGASVADYDDVRIYSGAADADAVAEIYADAPTPAASWDFEDPSSIDDLTTVGASIVTDEVQGQVLKVDKNTTSNNYVRLENPLYNQEATDFTVAMNILLEEDTDPYRGLWAFSSEAGNVGYFGMSRNGGLRYNGYLPAGEANHWYNTAGYGLGEDTAWHKLAVVVSAEDGTAKIYLDGTLTGTVNASSAFDSSGDAGVDIATLLADVPEYVTNQQYFFLGFASGSNWMTNGASYDNVAIYDYALTDLEIANLPGTAQVPEEEQIDQTIPMLVSREEGKWQVLDGDSDQCTNVSVNRFAANQDNFSIYGWFKTASYADSDKYMFLFDQWCGSGNFGLRLALTHNGTVYMWFTRANGSEVMGDTGYVMPQNENVFFAANYNGVDHKLSIYAIDSEGTHTIYEETNESVFVPISQVGVQSVQLGTSYWSDPVLDGRVADVYYSNSLFADVAAVEEYAETHPAPADESVSDPIETPAPELENLNIVELGTKEDGSATTVVYDDSDQDSKGNSRVVTVDGNAKAQLSTEKYVSETLGTRDETVDFGYRRFDTEAFLANADDFSITAWVRWYGDLESPWAGPQPQYSNTQRRFFDLFNIEEEEESAYEFFYSGWEEDIGDYYIARNPSITDSSELLEAQNDQQVWGGGQNVWANYEANAYLCGITAGAVLNGMSRPCFLPSETYAAGGSTNLPYTDWTHIAVVYDADGHVDAETGTVYGASLTYYMDGVAYATRYYDYKDFDSEADQWVQAFGDAAGFSEEVPTSSDSNLVGGSVDGADIIAGFDSPEDFYVSNMSLNTMYLGKSLDSTRLWNGEYQNAYMYNYAITSTEIDEDYVDNVKPFEGATMEEPTTATNISTNGTVYALVTEEEEASKTTELGFNTEWLSSAYRGSSSLSFNGDGGYAEVDTSVLLNEDGTVSDNLTFSTWVNVNDTLDWGRIFDIRGNNGEIFLSNNGFFNNKSNIGLGFRSSALSSAGLETSHTDTSVGQTLTAGTWVNVTVVIKGTSVKLYFQGDLQLEGEMEMTLSQMDIHTFYLSRSCAVDGKYGLPLDPDNDILLDETYLVLDALNDAQVRQLGQYGYAGAASSAVTEDNTRLEMMDVEDLFDESRNVDVMYIDITDHKTLSAEVMNELADSTGKTLYVRVQQGVSYDFVWVLSSEAFASANRTFTAADEFDLLVSGTNMSSADATTLLTRWNQINPSANVTLQAQTITVYADNLPVELPLFINYNREFLNSDGTTLSDVSLNLYRGTASSYTLVKKGLDPATDLYGYVLKQDYTNPSTGASGIVNQYYVQNLTQGGSFILTPNDLP